MNIILFCRIVYTDMQVFKCSKIQNTISTTDNGNKSRDNVRHLKTEFNNLNQSSATISKEENCLEEEVSYSQSIPSLTNNQNFVNGCQKRNEWAHENLERD